jgi:hypothetical protein
MLKVINGYISINILKSMPGCDTHELIHVRILLKSLKDTGIYSWEFILKVFIFELKFGEKMKKIIYSTLIFMEIMIIGCSKDETPPLPEGTHAVEVEEALDASQYTYMRVSEDDNEYWIAVPKMTVETGEKLYFSKSMVMNNFQSKTLNRTFDKILFVDDISKTLPLTNRRTQLNHPKIESAQNKDLNIEPLVDGKTIEQIFSEKDKIAGTRVKVRGKVIKFNPEIMDRNWIHLQDGTSSGDNFDLIITTKDQTAEGEIIVVEGMVSLNKNFGSGYVYPVIIENAEIK